MINLHYQRQTLTINVKFEEATTMKIEKTTAKNGRVYYYSVDEKGKKNRISEEKAEEMKAAEVASNESAEVKPVEKNETVETLESVNEKIDKINETIKKIDDEMKEDYLKLDEATKKIFDDNLQHFDIEEEYAKEKALQRLNQNWDEDQSEIKEQYRISYDILDEIEAELRKNNFTQYEPFRRIRINVEVMGRMKGHKKYWLDQQTKIMKNIVEIANETVDETAETAEVKPAEKTIEYVNKTGDSVMAIRSINISERGHGGCRVYEISISTYGGEYTKQEGLGKGFKRHFEDLSEAKKAIKTAAVRYGYVKAEIEENPTFDPQMIELLDEYERITYEKAKARNKRNLAGLERAVKLGHERSGIYDQLLKNNDYRKNHAVTLFAEIDKRVKRAEKSAEVEEVKPVESELDETTLQAIDDEFLDDFTITIYKDYEKVEIEEPPIFESISEAVKYAKAEYQKNGNEKGYSVEVIELGAVKDKTVYAIEGGEEIIFEEIENAIKRQKMKAAEDNATDPIEVDKSATKNEIVNKIFCTVAYSKRLGELKTVDVIYNYIHEAERQGYNELANIMRFKVLPCSITPELNTFNVGEYLKLIA